MANGATTLMFEGVPNYPDVSRFWQVVDKHKVEIHPSAMRQASRADLPRSANTTRSAAHAVHGAVPVSFAAALRACVRVATNASCASLHKVFGIGTPSLWGLPLMSKPDYLKIALIHD